MKRRPSFSLRTMSLTPSRPTLKIWRHYFVSSFRFASNTSNSNGLRCRVGARLLMNSGRNYVCLCVLYWLSNTKRSCTVFHVFLWYDVAMVLYWQWATEKENDATNWTSGTLFYSSTLSQRRLTPSLISRSASRMLSGDCELVYRLRLQGGPNSFAKQSSRSRLLDFSEVKHALSSLYTTGASSGTVCNWVPPSTKLSIDDTGDPGALQNRKNIIS